MKTKLTLAALIAASGVAQAEIPINENLAIQGFVDMSATYTDGDGFKEDAYGVDQVEVDFLFDFGDITGRIDIEYLGSSGTNDGFGVERAEFNYAFADEAGMLTAGRLQSLLGFEAFEPTGLYQYSFAYGGIAGVTGANLAAGYSDGVRYTYEAESSFFAISLQDSIYGDDGNLGDVAYGIEVATGYASEGLTLFLGAVYENSDIADTFWINSYVSYEEGPWVTAFELNYGEVDDTYDEISALVMANYAYSDVGSVTGRISYLQRDWDFYEEDGFKLTIANGTAVGDNLLLVQELSYRDGDEFGVGDYDAIDLAFEAIFVF